MNLKHLFCVQLFIHMMGGLLLIRFSQGTVGLVKGAPGGHMEKKHTRQYDWATV